MQDPDQTLETLPLGILCMYTNLPKMFLMQMQRCQCEEDRKRDNLLLQGRFVKHVFPGETLRTEMWQTGRDNVVFQTRVMERDEVAISNAAVTFREGTLTELSKL